MSFDPLLTVLGLTTLASDSVPTTFAPTAVRAAVRIAPAVLPSAPAAGALAIDSGDSNKFKWWDGSAWQTAGGGGGGGSVVLWAKILEAASISVSAATNATVNRLHRVSGTSADYTITMPSAVAGDVVGFQVVSWVDANRQYKLDAGAVVKIAGRTRYLVLLHSNVVLLMFDGTDWQPLVLNLDTPVVAYAMTVKADITNPMPNAGASNEATWRRIDGDLFIQWSFRQTAAGVAGSGHYYVELPLGVMDTNAHTGSPNPPGLWDVSAYTLGDGEYNQGAAFNGWLIPVPSSVAPRIYFTINQYGITRSTWRSDYGGLSVATINMSFWSRIPMKDW
jgi:hypothetical protein